VSIKTKLVMAMILMVLFSMFFISLAFYVVTSKTIENRVTEYAFEVLEKTDENLSTKLNQYENYLLQIISDKEIYNYITDDTNGPNPDITEVPDYLYRDSMSQNAEIRNKIYKLFGTNSGFYAVTFLFSNKVIYTHELVHERIISNRKTYTDLLYAEEGRAVWFPSIDSRDMFASLHTPRRVINVGRSITNRITGENTGIVILTVHEEEIYSSYEKLDVFEGSYSFIVDGSDNMISHSKRVKELNEDDIEIIHSVESNLTGKIRKDIDGESKVILYQRMNIQDWILVSVIPSRYLYADITSIMSILALVFLFMITASTILSILISKRISDPVKQLVVAMKEVEKGAMDVQVESNKQDEIGILTIQFNRMLLEINRLIERVYQEENQKYEAVYASLQAQITPHFLFNTLNSIKLMLDMEYPHKEILQITDSLIELLQAVTSKKDAFITLDEELLNVKNYVIIQNIRYGNMIELKIDVSEDIKRIIIPKLILQPIVENSIIHGFDFSSQKGEILISTREENGEINIYITDNGVGIDEEEIKKILSEPPDNERGKLNSIGVWNIHKRLKLIYGENYGVQIESKKNNYTTVNILIPIKTINPTK